eukprot:531041-Prymnesium_polylepis.1
MARSVMVAGVGLGAPTGRPRMTARASTRYLAPREPAPSARAAQKAGLACLGGKRRHAPNLGAVPSPWCTWSAVCNMSPRTRTSLGRTPLKRLPWCE